MYGIEGRYSAALFSAANKKDALEAVEKDLVWNFMDLVLLVFHLFPQFREP